MNKLSDLSLADRLESGNMDGMRVIFRGEGRCCCRWVPVSIEGQKGSV